MPQTCSSRPLQTVKGRKTNTLEDVKNTGIPSSSRTSEIIEKKYTMCVTEHDGRVFGYQQRNDSNHPA
ncbi:hypothetical protein CEXT_231541 [Caerostris extrusa]|uniref:Uncharacterized protein n=1 Tax=Caerostris extrusa TaxID=172846 RepID=A0AAV4T8J1_CAEEX|nr:hypothetical protein CEXT_231541 [Caerostris extrusa]